MSPPKHRTILLTGAPRPRDLNWDNGLLQNILLPSMKTFLDIQNSNLPNDSYTISEESSPISPVPKWRSVPLDPQAHLRTGLSPPFAEFSSSGIQSMSFEEPYNRRGVSFEFVSDLTSTVWEATSESIESISSTKFLEHSIAFHETLLSSQIAPHTSQEGASLTRSTGSLATSSFESTTTDNSSVRALQDLQDFLSSGPTSNNSHIPTNVTITALSALPSPTHLQSIHPQTPTPNLLVTLLSIPPPRTVTVRRTGKQMTLHDILVADETRSNLTITFWLPPHERALPNPETAPQQQPSKKPPPQHEQLRATLEGLRTGDIVLLRNIALTAFRGTVYGQSLNPSISRARTAVDVLVRDRKSVV